MVKKSELKVWNKMLRPTPIKVQIFDDYTLIISFDNGEVKRFDVKPYFKFKAFEPLKKIPIFKTVKPNGITVEWVGEIDICPDELYYNSEPLKDI